MILEKKLALSGGKLNLHLPFPVSGSWVLFHGVQHYQMTCLSWTLVHREPGLPRLQASLLLSLLPGRKSLLTSNRQ